MPLSPISNTGASQILLPGDQLETREITLRLNEVAENIHVQFSRGSNVYEWKISGYSPDHLILAFDPMTGYIQNHILASETWLLYPQHLSLSVQAGEGRLLEILPDLPGEWSKLKLECWDLTQTTCIGLIQNDVVFREIYVRSQEKIEKPTFENGNISFSNNGGEPTKGKWAENWMDAHGMSCQYQFQHNMNPPNKNSAAG